MIQNINQNINQIQTFMYIMDLLDPHTKQVLEEVVGGAPEEQGVVEGVTHVVRESQKKKKKQS